MVTCPQCQTSYDEEVSFCTKDGTALGGAESLNDECATAISDAPLDLEDVLDLSADLNAVEASEADLAQWQEEKDKDAYEVGSEKAPPSPEQEGEEEDEFAAAKNKTGAAELMSGAFVGEYQVEKKLAEGGMGVVYAAIQPLIGKRAAVKLLHRRFAKEKTVVDRFIQEARAVNTIQHENIVDIFSFGQLADGRHYFIMELLEGEDLARYLKKKKRLNLNEVMPILLQICQALIAAHDKNVVHRDLKPDNIHLLTKSDPPKVKLLDFGVAKLLDSEKQANMTNAGGLVGTPFYMSTEQCSGGAITAQADLYSLAVLTYEMLAGQVPFPGNYFEVITSHLQKPPPALPDDLDLGSVKADISALLQRSMAKDPKERPAGVKAFIETLEELALNSGQYVPPMVASGAHAALMTGRLKAITGNFPSGESVVAHKPITTLSGSAAELKAREAQGTAKVPNPLTAPNKEKKKPSTIRKVLPFAGGITIAAGLAVAAAFIFQKKPPAPVAVASAPVKVDPIRIESVPPGADIFDKDNFLLGQAPFSIDPSKEKTVVVRWRGHFSTSVDLNGKKGTLSVMPDLAAATKEPLLDQLSATTLSLKKDVMSKAHEVHATAAKQCEDCHAAELAVDGALCQSCHKKGGPGAEKVIANDQKQCSTCHADGFKATSKKYHIAGK